MKCANCPAESEPDNERHWREVTVTVGAVPPRVAGTKKVKDVLCPLCAAEADNALERRAEDGHAH